MSICPCIAAFRWHVLILATPCEIHAPAPSALPLADQKYNGKRIGTIDLPGSKEICEHRRGVGSLKCVTQHRVTDMGQ